MEKILIVEDDKVLLESLTTALEAENFKVISATDGEEGLRLACQEKIDLIIKELKLTAGKEELMTLKKYIDLWNPMNFVTQRDVERVIEEKLEALEKSKKE